MLSTGRFDRASLRELADAREDDIQLDRPIHAPVQERPRQGCTRTARRGREVRRRRSSPPNARSRRSRARRKTTQATRSTTNRPSRALDELERQARERRRAFDAPTRNTTRCAARSSSVDDSIDKLEGALGGNLEALAEKGADSISPEPAENKASDPRSGKPHRILLSPSGKPLTQARVRELAKLDHLVLVCGRYEGIDQRVIDLAIDEELSIGDYVLSGGELGALVIIDAVARYVPGVLGEATSVDDESFSAGLLEYPQYTRPPSCAARAVPPRAARRAITRSIAAWRASSRCARTAARRPDLLRAFQPTKADDKLFAAAARAHAPRARPSSRRRSRGRRHHDGAHELRHSRPRALVDDVRPRGLSHRHADHLAAREGASTSPRLWIEDEQGEHRAPRAAPCRAAADSIEAGDRRR